MTNERFEAHALENKDKYSRCADAIKQACHGVYVRVTDSGLFVYDKYCKDTVLSTMQVISIARRYKLSAMATSYADPDGIARAGISIE